MKARIVPIVVGLVLVATACLRSEIDIDVADDGSVVYSGVVAVDPDVLETLGSLFGELDETAAEDLSRDAICDEFVADQGLDDVADGAGLTASVEPYDEDGFCGVRFELQADDVSALQQQSTAQDIILREEPDGGWYFELPLDEAGEAGDLAAFPGLGDAFDDAGIEVRVKLPGTQVDHNADEIATDGTMIWSVDLLDPPAGSLFLRTEPGDPITGSADPEGAASGDDGSDTVLIIVLVILALAAIAAAVWWFSRKKGSEGSPAADPFAAPATGATVGADGAWNAAPTSPPQTDAGHHTTPPAPSPTPDATEPLPTVATAPTPAPATDTTTEQPAVVASPSPEQATGQAVWDPVRRAYVQWDPVAGHWLVFDNDAQQWRTGG